MEDFYYKYYKLQSKGGQIGNGSYVAPSVHRGVRFQRGYGIGSIFGTIFRRLFPVVSTAVKKVGNVMKEAGVRDFIRDTARDASQTLVRAGLDTATAGLQGENIKERAASAFAEAGKHIAQRAVDNIRNRVEQGGSGNRRKSIYSRRNKRVITASPRSVKRRQLTKADQFGVRP